MLICEYCNKLNPYIENIYYNNKKNNICILIKCHCNNKLVEKEFNYRINKEDNMKIISDFHLKELYNNLNKCKKDIKNKFKNIFDSIEELIILLNKLKTICENKEKEFYYKIYQYLNLFEYFNLNIQYPEIKIALNKFEIKNEFNIDINANILFGNLKEKIQSINNYINNFNFRDDCFKFKVYKLINEREILKHYKAIYNIIKLNSINKLASCSGDSNINIYNIDNNFNVFIQLKYTFGIFKLYEFKKNKQLLGTSLSIIIIWNLITFQIISKIDISCNIIWDFLFANLNNNLLYIFPCNNCIYLYNNFFEFKYSLKGHNQSIRQIIQISNKNIVSGSWDGYLMAWDLNKKKNILMINLESPILQLDEINKNIVICSIKLKGIQIIDMKNGNILKYFKFHLKIYVLIKDQNKNFIILDKNGNFFLINKDNYNILFNTIISIKSIKSGYLFKNNNLILGDKNGKISFIKLN